MFLDKQNLFSNGQAVTASAASTDIIDLGVDRDIGMTNIRLRSSIDEALASAGATTVTIDLQTSNDPAFGSFDTIFSSGVIGKAAGTRGAVLVDAAVPRKTKRYLRVYYTVATGPFTAGKFDTFLAIDTEARRDYPNAI